MSFEGIDTIFNPGLRHWREYQDFQRARVLVIPALDKGPHPGRMRIDLDHGEVVIDPDAPPAPPTVAAPDGATPSTV